MNIVNSNIKKYWILALIAAYFAFAYLTVRIPDEEFHIYFLNVDQGDSVFIKTPENHQILIDGGPKNYVLKELDKVMSFFNKTFDLVVLTHPHYDHYAGLSEVIKRYKIKNILITGVNAKDNGYIELLALIKEKKINTYFAESYTDFKFGEVYFDIIYPFDSIKGETFSKLNNSSISMHIFYKNKSILLNGDLEKEGEKDLIENVKNLKANIFKASHHGSKTANTLDFLQRVKPEIAIIQVGKNNKFNHPHAETIKTFKALGIKYFRTDLNGTKEFVF